MQTKLTDSLSPDLTQQLFARTEGWVTSLRPAMLTHLQQLIQKATLTTERKNALQGEISAIQSLLSYFEMVIVV